MISNQIKTLLNTDVYKRQPGDAVTRAVKRGKLSWVADVACTDESRLPYRGKGRYANQEQVGR